MNIEVGQIFSVTHPIAPGDEVIYQILNDNVEDDGRGSVELQTLEHRGPGAVGRWALERNMHPSVAAIYESGGALIPGTGIPMTPSPLVVYEAGESKMIVERPWFDDDNTGRTITPLESALGREEIFLARLGIIRSTDAGDNHEIMRIDDPEDYRAAFSLSFTPPLLESDDAAQAIYESLPDGLVEAVAKFDTNAGYLPFALFNEWYVPMGMSDSMQFVDDIVDQYRTKGPTTYGAAEVYAAYIEMPVHDQWYNFIESMKELYDGE